jgi:hypothetical protein
MSASFGTLFEPYHVLLLAPHGSGAYGVLAAKHAADPTGPGISFSANVNGVPRQLFVRVCVSCLVAYQQLWSCRDRSTLVVFGGPRCEAFECDRLSWLSVPTVEKPICNKIHRNNVSLA